MSSSTTDFGNGIKASYARNSRFEHLALSTNLFVGIWLDGKSGLCSGNTIAHCSASDNGNSGIAIEPP
jgi:hypothetical protein